MAAFTSPYRACRKIEKDLLEANPNFIPPETWRARSAALNDLSQLPAPTVGEHLQRLLRDYQKIGVSWMMHLFRNRLGES